MKMGNLFSQSFNILWIGMTAHPIAPQVFKKHDAHCCLKPEKTPSNTPLSISLSPSDKQQYYENPKRLEVFRSQLYGRLLIHVAPYASYDLYVEISEAGRLHCHGTISIKDVLGFYLYAIPFMRDAMTYEIDTINDMQTWINYCTKGAHMFSDGLNPRITSTKDPLFILTKTKSKAKVETKAKKITFDHYQNVSYEDPDSDGIIYMDYD